MAKIRFTSIKPGLVFEHEGVKLKAVEQALIEQCDGCVFRGICNYRLPCTKDDDVGGKQEYELIFQKVENE